MIRCADCEKELRWTGRGRKPRRCKPCARQANRNGASKTKIRERKHEQGVSASRWGDLWLVDGKPVRRDKNQVWGSMDGSDETVESMSGVFHKAGADGLPGQGFSTNYEDLRAVLIARTNKARKEPWLKDHPDWWRFEEWAHGALSRDITDSVIVHAGELMDEPDEHTPAERCSWCCERRPLILAGEFCSDECMTDWLTTFGAHGLELERGSSVHDEGGVAARGGQEDDAVVRGARLQAA